MNGILNLYKPVGITSHTAVSIVRRIFDQKKVGHTGTLDPLASGVLPILIGNAVKISEYLICDDKKYKATLKLGIQTDTEDITGKIIAENNNIPDEKKIRETIMSFVGEYMQIPPMYSAIKIDGKKLYEIARKGGEIERVARKVTIYSIEILNILDDSCEIIVGCSKGTYIRTLCADIGKKLSCGGVMAALERQNVGGFGVDNSITLEKLKELSKEDLAKTLIAVEEFFGDLKKIILPQFYSNLAKNGAEIYQSRAKFDENIYVGEKVLMYDNNLTLFALGQLMEFEDGNAIKPIKMFN